MLICHCRAVNDQTVRTIILTGVREPAELARRCGAGSCGGCLPTLLELLEDLDAAGDSDVRTSVA